MAAILDPACRLPWVAKPDHWFLFKKQNGSKWRQMHIYIIIWISRVSTLHFKMKYNKLLLEIFNFISRYLISDSVKMRDEVAFLENEEARQRAALYSANVHRNSTYLSVTCFPWSVPPDFLWLNCQALSVETFLLLPNCHLICFSHAARHKCLRNE